MGLCQKAKTVCGRKRLMVHCLKMSELSINPVDICSDNKQQNITHLILEQSSFCFITSLIRLEGKFLVPQAKEGLISFVMLGGPVCYFTVDNMP